MAPDEQCKCSRGTDIGQIKRPGQFPITRLSAFRYIERIFCQDIYLRHACKPYQRVGYWPAQVQKPSCFVHALHRLAEEYSIGYDQSDHSSSQKKKRSLFPAVDLPGEQFHYRGEQHKVPHWID